MGGSGPRHITLLLSLFPTLEACFSHTLSVRWGWYLIKVRECDGWRLDKNNLSRCTRARWDLERYSWPHMTRRSVTVRGFSRLSRLITHFFLWVTSQETNCYIFNFVILAERVYFYCWSGFLEYLSIQNISSQTLLYLEGYTADIKLY